VLYVPVFAIDDIAVGQEDIGFFFTAVSERLKERLQVRW
jgi:hypothetical protein